MNEFVCIEFDVINKQINKIKMSNQKRGDEAKKITIREFEWYEMETKVRELLTELLHPFTKKQTEDTIKINEIKRNITSMTRKIDDHDFLLTQEGPQKPTYVQLQDDKIETITNRFNSLEEEQNLRIAQMEKTIEVYEAKIMQLNKLESRLDLETKERGELLNSHKEHVDSQLELMFKKLQNQDQEINTLRQTTRNTISKVETKIVVLDNKTISLEDDLKRRTSEIRKLFDMNGDLSQRISKQELEIKELDVRIAEREKDYKLSEKFMSKVQELNNDISFVTNYLQFYQPLYNQIQISETLGSFVKGPSRMRLCLYEEKNYAKMHYSILKMESERLDTKMSEYSDRIRRIINKNKKYIIRLKIDQTLKYGSNIYELREFSEEMISEMEEAVQSKPPPVIIPEEEITKIVEEKWESMSKSYEGQIKQKLKPMEIWLTQLQEQSLLKDIAIENKVNELKQLVAKEEANLGLVQAASDHAEKQLNQRITHLTDETKKTKEYLKDVISFSSVINHIVIQDEIDRQGLALYALKGSQKGQTQPNIHLDEKCVSCSNGNANAIVNQAFKVACLAYNPSEIKVDDQSFSREEILEISTRILDKLKKKMDEVSTLLMREKPEKVEIEGKNRSRSSISRQNKSHTIDAPTRLRDTTYLLPVLGSVKKKAAIGRRDL